MATTSNDKCLYKKKAEDRHREKRRPYEDRGRDWSFAATSHGMPGAGRGKDESSLEPPDGEQLYDTKILDFWPLKLQEKGFLLL